MEAIYPEGQGCSNNHCSQGGVMYCKDEAMIKKIEQLDFLLAAVYCCMGC